MSWNSFSTWVQAIPLALQWALAIVGTAIGLSFILRGDAIVRGLRKWLWYQLRLVRGAGYRRMLRLYGWLLFATGILLILLLAIRQWGRLIEQWGR